VSARAEALDAYRSLQVPDTTEEHWRFTDLRGFDPDAFGQARGQTPDVSAGASMLALDVAAEAVVTETGIEITRAPSEIRFEPLDESHERLGTLVGWEDDKFAAHNAAAWQHGLLVHVPAGLELERPLFVRVVNAIENGALFWRLLVVAEEGSRFSLVEEYSSASSGLPGYFNGVAELFVEQAAKLEYVSLQNLSKETWHFGRHRALLQRDSELDWVLGGFGSKRGKTRIQNDLAGPGATSRVTGAYFGDGEQHLDFDTFQEHIAPNTTSDFAFKGALRDHATAVWRGMIKVEKDAQKTNAYQENRNLILSEQAHADSIPGLEIEANDVRCTHGATISPVNRDELFYAMARGISRGEAERLIVRGFFTDVLNRIELEPVREAVTEALEARIPQA
jgi:Fe-S cluster assembly protein SufD